MKHVICLIALGLFAAGPSFADNAFVKKPLTAQSVRMAQNLCLKRGEECCCDRAGPLCCQGLQCVVKGNRGTCQ